LKRDVIRSTIYFEPDLHEALRLRSASSHRSISDLANEAVRESLREDYEELATIAERVYELT
jgi:plasmid stability protein